ncbi:hypothetical protein DUNSADRAFT_4315 [Dunaliella salina]|uniref:Uncharacterized protein n=1 Tax=Dunaliella salina TaxID=3046 RepID=A0ABZ3LN58_DUNSA|nr:hypothetical protein DUNSADRAFT_4315 [Dunaliella salina]|eukprot:KAF5842856.1 hypothetical protein DUNSADRAFT_4315 [Dunaliella salina]
MAMPDALWSLLQQLEAEVAAANTRAGRDSSRSSQSDLASLDQGLLGSAPKTPPSATGGGAGGVGAGALGLGLIGSTPKAPFNLSGGGIGAGLLLEGPQPGHALLSSVVGGGGGTRAAELVVHQAVLVLRRLREQNRKMAKVLSRISREGSIVHQLEDLRASKEAAPNTVPAGDGASGIKFWQELICAKPSRRALYGGAVRWIDAAMAAQDKPQRLDVTRVQLLKYIPFGDGVGWIDVATAAMGSHSNSCYGVVDGPPTFTLCCLGDPSV